MYEYHAGNGHPLVSTVSSVQHGWEWLVHPLSFHQDFPTLVGKYTTSNVVFLAQNEANYRDLLFNKMVQQTSWQANLHVYFRREDTPVWSSY